MLTDVILPVVRTAILPILFSGAIDFDNNGFIGKVLNKIKKIASKINFKKLEELIDVLTKKYEENKINKMIEKYKKIEERWEDEKRRRLKEFHKIIEVDPCEYTVYDAESGEQIYRRVRDITDDIFR